MFDETCVAILSETRKHIENNWLCKLYRGLVALDSLTCDWAPYEPCLNVRPLNQHHLST